MQPVPILPATRLGRFHDLAFKDFELRLRALNRLLEREVSRQVPRQSESERPVEGLFVTPQDAERLLHGIISLEPGEGALQPLAAVTESERDAHEELRKCAAATGHRLPFERLAEELQLGAFELDVVTLCAAAELDRAYGRLFGFILDNLNRQTPSIELVCTLGNPGIRERLARRRVVSPQARLRRSGLVVAVENPERPVYTTLALAPLAFRRLTQPGPWWDRFFDPDLVVGEAVDLDRFPQGETLASFAAAVRQGRLEVCGIWGGREHGVNDAVAALAVAANRPLFRVPPPDTARLNGVLAAAEDRHGMLWVSTDALGNAVPDGDLLREALAGALTRTALPVCLSGDVPWRPTELLAARDYAEIRMARAPSHSRLHFWRGEFAEFDDSHLRDAAARFRLSPSEVQAVGRLVRSAALIEARGDGSTPAQRLEEACMQITQRHGMRFARLIEPKRGPDDLVLPENLHRQVLEVARFYRALLLVDDEWGFLRIATGGGGIKALFTGESGTGKTLAAEVIAGQLGLGLMRIDVSQLVSKWVGETEKNLDSAFREAEDSHAVLFLDEADTLCGKRGEIHNGSDRYANLEVGFLLQRLEQYGGLAILATNLSDEMDQAFVRRFQVAIHFPRPREVERRRLWQIAFPEAAPLEDGIDFDALVKLDMTGAGIAGAARMAALLAADERSDRISERHVKEGIRRQYQQEARLLNEDVLKP